jgi:LPXTG-motif cell wall-anchored protein
MRSPSPENSYAGLQNPDGGPSARTVWAGRLRALPLLPLRLAIWQAPLILLLAWDLGPVLLLFWVGGIVSARLAALWQRWFVQLLILVTLVSLAAITVPVQSADFFILLLVGLLPLTWRLQEKGHEQRQSGESSPAELSPAELSPAGLTPTIFLVGAVFLYQMQFFILLSVIIWLLVFLFWLAITRTGYRLDAVRVRWLPVIGMSGGMAALIILMFVAIPRITSGFIPGFTAQQQKIALTDHVEPGGMRDLLADDTIAFRAMPLGKIDNTPRYWRVFVLDAERDGKWMRTANGPAPMRQLTSMKPDHEFSLLLDDHNPSTLPAPGWPSGFSVDYGYTAHGELVTNMRANPRQIIVGGSTSAQHLASGPVVSMPSLSDANERLVTWARQYRATARDDAAFVAAMMQMFASDFVYDTTIDYPENGALDSFFFDGRRGYCAYFATAMATALRAAGIEANIVMGYLGTDWNGYGNFWTIRNADAHAWVEARLDGGGWQRIDPTLVVRAGGGPAMASSALDPQLPDGRQPKGGMLAAQLRAAGQWIDALNTRLTIAIMGYGGHRDDDASGQTGDHAALVFVAIGFAMIGVLLASGFVILFRRRPQHARAEHQFVRLLERLDVASPRRAGETIITFAVRITSQMPSELAKQTDQINQIAAMLTRFRHAPQGDVTRATISAELHACARDLRQMRRNRRMFGRQAYSDAIRF